MKILKVGNVDVLLDDDDWLRLCRHKWRVKSHGKSYKNIARSKTINSEHRTIYMHREIMDTPKGMECHHKEGNVFDNRKEMLENLTKQEHMAKDWELSFKIKKHGNGDIPF